MIYRKILRVKTVGSRKTRNLAPAIMPLPKGFNFTVLEYSPDEKECVVEVWCSDHPILAPEERKTKADLDALFSKSNPAVLDSLSSHPSSPKMIGRIMVFSEVLEAIDDVTKTATFKGRTGKFIRKETMDVHGITKEIIILDEG